MKLPPQVESISRNINVAPVDVGHGVDPAAINWGKLSNLAKNIIKTVGGPKGALSFLGDAVKFGFNNIGCPIACARRDKSAAIAMNCDCARHL